VERTACHISIIALLTILVLTHHTLVNSPAEPREIPPLGHQLPAPPATLLEQIPPSTPSTVTSVVLRLRIRVSKIKAHPTSSTQTTRSPDRPFSDVWMKLRECESGDRYDANTGNGYFGAYQFHPQTWRSLGFPGLPHQAPPEVQDEAARRLQARSGWGQWPACSRRIGAR
jgi:hypothetical protein